jgi:hypothetical protein
MTEEETWQVDNNSIKPGSLPELPLRQAGFLRKPLRNAATTCRVLSGDSCQNL